MFSVGRIMRVALAAACLASPAALAQPTELFISEYIEGSSNNKAIEIFNGTGGTVNLATGVYDLQVFFNGSGTAGLTIALTGSVANNDVYVVAQSSASATILAQADQTNGSGWFNGDDAVVLRKGGVVIDAIGQVGLDPGTEWGTGLVSTADNTLRRKSSVCAGDTNSTNTFDPSVEWDGFATDTFSGLGSHSVSCGGGITLSINDVNLAEGDSGTTTFTFTVSLSSPAGAGGVTFDIATADGTAGQPGDYTQNSLTGQTIPAGSSTYTFDVLVNGETAVEPNETFFVNVTNVVGATVTDGQGQGTIQNDDVTLTPIHDIQGPGASSPFIASSLTTRGIVTGVKSNGFFIQEADATVDADPATSEGILVFTSGAPPAAAAVGNLVQVTGTVSEFVPSQDPLQAPLTELTSPSVVLVSSGNPLPAPVSLSVSFPDPAGVFDQLERLEGMRVSLASMTVSGPTIGSVNEANATATSTGVFFGVVTGVARPFREAGIQAPDPAPSGGGTIPPIPRWDQNPEVLRVDSDGLVGGPLIDVGVGAVVTGLLGPLDYSFRRYTILPDPASSPAVFGGPVAAAASVATAQEFTVAAYNLERFFDTVNDPGIGEPVLTASAFDNRLNKASLAIRDFLQAPDIVGSVEMENLTTLQALAARISSDAIAAAQPDPQYDAYLVEGNDVGGIDVGFLVKTAEVSLGTPRVEVVEIQQELAGSMLVNPDASTGLLNDRPPLRLDAIVHHPNGSTFPVTVIVNHLRSLNGVGDESPGPNGWPTEGARVRAKRQKQAEDLANLVQARQTSDPAQHIVLVGDFNAFEFNDGFGDSMNVIGGTPTADNQTAVPGDGVDLVNPDLDNLFDTPPSAERYSYVFDGNAQSLDHILVNAPLVADTLARRIEHPRLDADFPETARNDGTTAVRLSDHDPVLAYFQVNAFAVADLGVTKVDSPDPVTAGNNISYTITLNNAGPSNAADVDLSDTLPVGTTFVSLASPGGWGCTTPAVGSGGTVTCTIASLPPGSSVFTLTVAVSVGVPGGTVLTNTAAASSSTTDPVTGNESGSADTTVAAPLHADISVLKVDAPDPVAAGANLTYTIDVSNEGPDDALSVTLDDPLPLGTTFVSLSSPGGWICTAPAVGSGGTVSCSMATFPIGTATFTLVVLVDAATPNGTVLSNTATIAATTIDLQPGDHGATADTTVMAPPTPGLTLTKTDDVDPVAVGGNLTYTIVASATNLTGASAQLADTVPTGTTFVSFAAPAGWTCSTPAVGETGAVSCSLPSLADGSSTFTLIVAVGSLPSGSVVHNHASIQADTGERTADASADQDTAVMSPANVTATKSAAGAFTPGSTVTYTVTLSNAGPGDQPDGSGDEFTDLLPAQLALVSATATSGTAVATVATNTVTWNGSIAAGGSVTVTIQATLTAVALPGSTVDNQGSFAYDGDGNGTNESSGTTDDPSTAAAGDATRFVVTAPAVIEIPALGGLAAAILALLLAMAALVALRGGRP